MRRRPLILGILVVVAVAALGIGILAIQGPTEPRFEGRPLSAWLDQREAASRTPTSDAFREPDRAVRTLGPEAIPVLVAWISRNPTAAERLVERAQRAWQWPRLVQTTQNRKRAVQGFQALGPATQPAYQALVELAVRSTDRGQRQDATAALRLADVAAVRLIAAELLDDDPAVRLHAVEALGRLPIAPDEVSLPAFERAKRDPDALVAGAAAQFFATTEQNLIQYATWLDSTSPLIRASALRQIGGYRARARPLLPHLEAACHDPDPTVRQVAAACLSQVRGSPGP